MIDELYLYSYANEPNKSPGRERLGALLPLRETATFPPQADHVLVVFFFIRGGTWGAALKPPDTQWNTTQSQKIRKFYPLRQPGKHYAT